MGQRGLRVLVEERSGGDEVGGHLVGVPRVEAAQGYPDRLVELPRVGPLREVGPRRKRRTALLAVARRPAGRAPCARAAVATADGPGRRRHRAADGRPGDGGPATADGRRPEPPRSARSCQLPRRSASRSASGRSPVGRSPCGRRSCHCGRSPVGRSPCGRRSCHCPAPVHRRGRSPCGRRSCHCGRSPVGRSPCGRRSCHAAGHPADDGPATADGRRSGGHPADDGPASCRTGRRVGRSPCGRRSCHCGRSPVGRSPCGRRSCQLPDRPPRGRSPWGDGPATADGRRSAGHPAGDGPATADGPRSAGHPADDGPATADGRRPAGHPADDGPATADDRRSDGHPADDGPASCCRRHAVTARRADGHPADDGPASRRAPARGRLGRCGRSPWGRSSCLGGRCPLGPPPKDRPGCRAGLSSRDGVFLCPSRRGPWSRSPSARGARSAPPLWRRARARRLRCGSRPGFPAAASALGTAASARSIGTASWTCHDF